MRTPSSICRHPIHPMLVIFPISLWIFSLACDLIYLAGLSGEAWAIVAFYSMVGGLIGALCASGVCDQYRAARQQLCGSGRSSGAFNYRRGAAICIWVASQPDSACLWRGRRRPQINRYYGHPAVSCSTPGIVNFGTVA